MMSDESQNEMFRCLGRIETGLEELKKLAPIVEKHERVYNVAKVAAVPSLVALHMGIKLLLSKLGFQ